MVMTGTTLKIKINVCRAHKDFCRIYEKDERWKITNVVYVFQLILKEKQSMRDEMTLMSIFFINAHVSFTYPRASLSRVLASASSITAHPLYSD